MFGLGDVREGLERVAAGFDPAVLSAEQAEAAVDHATTIEHMAATIKARAAARVAETGRWRQGGDRSAADWLSRRTGTSRGQADDAIRTGARLANQGETAAAATQGKLSPAQASEIAAAAAADPHAERRLVELAAKGASLGELRDECRRVRAAADPDPDGTHHRIHAGRYLRRFTDAEGGWNMRVRNTPEVGAQIDAALRPIIEEIFRAARAKGEHEPVEAYAADALTELARQALDDDGEAVTEAGGDDPGDTASARPPADGPPDRPTGGGAAAPARPRSKKRPPYLALLRLDVEALRRGHAEGDELVEITGIGPIPVSRALELLGESVLKLVITKGVDVANVTHLGRGVSAAQGVALLWTSPQCDVMGCHRTRQLEHDHAVPWAEVHETRLGNMRRLCSHHHDLKTHQGWDLVEGSGRRSMVPPDDPRHPKHASKNANAPPEAATPTGQLPFDDAGDPEAA